MSRFDDHLPCPALHKWLPAQWEGRTAAGWICPPQPRWKAPRALRRLLSRNGVETPEAVPDPASLDVLVVVSPIPGPRELIDDAHWAALRPGGTLIDLASMRRRGVGELLRPWVHLRRLRTAAAQRLRHWLERGAYGPEQWTAVTPGDVVVTIVQRAVLSGRVASDEAG